MDSPWGRVWAALKEALRSNLTVQAGILIGLCVLITLPFGFWLVSGWTERHELVRWKDTGPIVETPELEAAVLRGEKRAREEGERPYVNYSFPRVSVYSVPNVRPPETAPTLKDLSDEAQAHAIDAIARASGSQARPWEELRQALANGNQPGEKDPFLFERVLVATLAKGTRWMAGDRMVWARILVGPINFRFAAYTIAATDTETVKVSSVEATDVRKLSPDIGLTVPGLGEAKVSGLGVRENTVKTTSDITSQYERLGIDITPEFLRIVRESGAGGDVVGNTRIALSLTTDPSLILKGHNAQVATQDISLVVTGLHLDETSPWMDILPVVPLPHCPLKARVMAVYEQRRIQRGREFYDEGKHEVTFIHDVDDRDHPVTIMGEDDVSPFVWRIQLVPVNDQPKNDWEGRDPLTVHVPGGQSRQLLFSDYGKAVRLAHWIRTHDARRLAGGRDPEGEEYIFDYDGKMWGMAIVKQTGDECRGEGKPPIVKQPPPNRKEASD